MNYLMNILPTSSQTYRFDWISLAFGVIVLFAFIRGIRKGFVYTLIKLFGLIIVFFLAYLLAKPIGTWIYSLNGWGDTVQSNFLSFLLEKGANNPVGSGDSALQLAVQIRFGSTNAMEWIITRDDLNTVLPGSDLTVLETALNSVGIPSFLKGFVGNFVINAVPESGVSQSLGYYLSCSLASLTFVAIGFVAIFAVGLIVLLIAKIVGKAINKWKVIGPMNRLLGGILGIVIGFIDVSLLSALLVSLSSYTPIYNWLDQMLFLSDDSIYTIGKMFYNNNFLELLMGYYNSIVSSIVK